AGAAVLYALAAGTLVSLAGFALTDALFHLMGVPREVASVGRAYLDTWLLGGPLVFGFFAIEATFRASGDTRTPFLLLMVSVVLSVGLDPLLISGVGPFPRLGVEGAALASVMVRGGGFLIGISLALRRGLIRLGAPDWRAVPIIFRVGAPLSLSGVLFSLIYMWLTRFTSRFGTPALGGAGYTFWPMVASSSLSALRIPLAAWWSAAFGLAGIWWAISLTAVARGGAMSLLWLSGAWRHRTL